MLAGLSLAMRLDVNAVIPVGIDGVDYVGIIIAQIHKVDLRNLMSFITHVIPPSQYCR